MARFNVVVILIALQVVATIAQVPYCGVQPGFDAEFSIPKPQDGMTLVQVHTFIRHGDRLPASSGSSSGYAQPCWPGDNAVWNCTLNYDEIPDNMPGRTSTSVPRLYRKEYNAGANALPGNCELGQLTQDGYMQHLYNGKVLRAAYVEGAGLLNPEFDTSEIYMRSDDEPRTVQSAHSIMLGMFPPNDTNVAQLINLHTMDVQVDDTVVNPNICPILNQVWLEAFETPSYMEHFNNVTLPLMYALSSALGIPVTQVSTGYLWDCANTHLCHGFPLPDSFTMDLYNQLVAENIYQFSTILTYPNTTYNSQIGIGFYLSDFAMRLNQFASGEDDTKFYLWSGHDLTLFAIQIAMGFYPGGWPPYASVMNFEVYEDASSDLYVRIVYNGVEMALPACQNQTYCPFTTFYPFLETLLPVNPAVSCMPTNGTATFDPIFYMKPEQAIQYAIRRGQANLMPF